MVVETTKQLQTQLPFPHPALLIAPQTTTDWDSID